MRQMHVVSILLLCGCVNHANLQDQRDILLYGRWKNIEARTYTVDGNIEVTHGHTCVREYFKQKLSKKDLFSQVCILKGEWKDILLPEITITSPGSYITNRRNQQNKSDVSPLVVTTDFRVVNDKLTLTHTFDKPVKTKSNALIDKFVTIWVREPEETRYILDIAPDIHEKPDKESKKVSSGWQFGRRNVGPSIRNGAWESFSYVSDSGPSTFLILGWIESKHLIDEYPTPDNLLRMFRDTKKSDYAERSRLAKIASEAYRNSTARTLIEEFNNVEPDVVIERNALRNMQVYFLVSGHRPVTITPISLVDNGEFISVPDGTDTREVYPLPDDGMERKRFVKERAFVHEFMQKGRQYKLLKTGVVLGETIVLEQTYPCSTCSGLSGTAELHFRDDHEMNKGDTPTYIATNAVIRDTGDRRVRKATVDEDRKLLRAARTELSRRKVPLRIINSLKPYGSLALQQGAQQPFAIASSFSYRYPVNEKSTYGSDRTAASYQLFLFMTMNSIGKYELVYSFFNHAKDSELIESVNLIDFMDFDNDGRDDLLLKVEGGFEDGWSHFLIIKGQEGGYQKIYKTGFSSYH